MSELDGLTERIAEAMKRHTVMHSATAGRDICVTCGPLTPEHSTPYRGIFDRERTHQAEQVRAVLGETTTEWGVRDSAGDAEAWWTEGDTEGITAREAAEDYLEGAEDGASLITRTVTPWIEAP